MTNFSSVTHYTGYNSQFIIRKIQSAVNFLSSVIYGLVYCFSHAASVYEVVIIEQNHVPRRLLRSSVLFFNFFFISPNELFTFVILRFHAV